MIGLFRRLDGLHTLEEKKQMMSFFDDIRVNTVSLSYTGRLDLTECEKFIESMHLYSSGNNDILVNMMSVGTTTTVNFIQPFEDECYVDALKELMKNADIQFTVTERIKFNTPRDGIAETPAVSAVRKHHNLLREYIDSLE